MAPTPELAAASNLRLFMDRHGISSLDELQLRSTRDIEWFWKTVLDELDIRFEEPFLNILDLSSGIQWPRWCTEGRLNIISNCLDKYAGTPTDSKIAIRWEHETGLESGSAMTYAQLRDEVNRAANYFRALGVGKGVVIGVFMPMVPECVIAMLAIIKIGAVFLPLFSGFGASAVASRLADAEAVALVTTKQFHRRGQAIPLLEIAKDAAAQAKSVQQVILPEWNRYPTARQPNPPAPRTS